MLNNYCNVCVCVWNREREIDRDRNGSNRENIIHNKETEFMEFMEWKSEDYHIEHQNHSKLERIKFTQEWSAISLNRM